MPYMTLPVIRRYFLWLRSLSHRAVPDPNFQILESLVTDWTVQIKHIIDIGSEAIVSSLLDKGAGT